MKRIITASLVATLALTGAQAASNAQLSAQLGELETQLAKVKKSLKKQNKKINAVKAHDSGDNIKWGADIRTSYDNINYDMAGPAQDSPTTFNGPSSHGKSSLYSLRLWLNMAYAPNANNVFKGQLSMNKAFGASFDNPMNRMFDAFDWTSSEALTDNTLRVRQAYWLYLGEEAFGLDMPWTFSLGRRPSTGGFLANLAQDDAAQSPLGHVINVEFDGLSSKLDLSKVTGVPGMSIKLCMGYGSTNAVPLIGSATPNADLEANNMDDIKLAGFIFEPYNDGQFITKATWYKAYDLPDANFEADGTINPFNPQPMTQVGDMEGAALSVLVDGLTEEGYLADAKVFGSFAWSESTPNGNSVTNPDGTGGTFDAPGMFGSMDSESGTSYWFGAYLPVTDGENNYGTVGLEYNHGSQFWRPFTYAEDTMIGSKLAARGDAWEINYTYQINEALSCQARYVSIDYEYTGSNGFFGSSTGTAVKVSDVKAGLYGPGMAANTIDKSDDLRLYLRYRF